MRIKKILVLMICFVLVAIPFVSADVVLSKENAELFIALYPVYRQLSQQKVKDSTEIYENITALLEKYDISLEEWAQLQVRVMQGYMFLQAQKANSDVLKKGFFGSKLALPDDELNVIQEYFSQIKSVLEASE